LSAVWLAAVGPGGMTARMTTRASDDAGCAAAVPGFNVKFLTATHPAESAPRQAKLEAARPIGVGDNIWLGGGLMVCPGGIGENTVVGAGAVGSGTCPPTWSPLPPSPRHPLAVTAGHRRERSAVGPDCRKQPQPDHQRWLVGVETGGAE
jgi:hypothetical protein